MNACAPFPTAPLLVTNRYSLRLAGLRNSQQSFGRYEREGIAIDDHIDSPNAIRPDREADDHEGMAFVDPYGGRLVSNICRTRSACAPHERLRDGVGAVDAVPQTLVLEVRCASHRENGRIRPKRYGMLVARVKAPDDVIVGLRQAPNG
jgi:hypothetical protein